MLRIASVKQMHLLENGSIMYLVSNRASANSKIISLEGLAPSKELEEFYFNNTSSVQIQDIYFQQYRKELDSLRAITCVEKLTMLLEQGIDVYLIANYTEWETSFVSILKEFLEYKRFEVQIFESVES